MPIWFKKKTNKEFIKRRYWFTQTRHFRNYCWSVLHMELLREVPLSLPLTLAQW